MKLQIAKLAGEAAKHVVGSLPAVAQHFGPVAFAKANLIRRVAPYAGPAGLVLTAAVGSAIVRISKENLHINIKTKRRNIIVQTGDKDFPKAGLDGSKRTNKFQQIDQELPELRQPRAYDEN